MAAAWLRRQEGVRGIGGGRREAAGHFCRRRPPGSGRGAFRWGAADADVGLGGPLGDDNPRNTLAGFSQRSFGDTLLKSLLL